LGSNAKGYGGKTHYTDSQHSDTTAPSGTELCIFRSRRPVRKLLDTSSFVSLTGWCSRFPKSLVNCVVIRHRHMQAIRCP